MSKSKTSDADPLSGIIEPDKLYDFEAIKRITGVGRAGLREARRDGLNVRYFGRRGYVLGSDVIEHIKLRGRTER